MALVRWDPFRELDSLHSRFGRYIGGVGKCGSDEAGNGGTTWVPSADIVENEKDFIVRAELAGVDPKEVRLTVNENVLTISGERKFDYDDEKDNYHRLERLYGSFTRSFTLPRTIDEDKIHADYKHGVLTIRLTKHEIARAKQIQIAS